MSVNVHEEINNSINILLDPNKEEKEYNYAFIVLGEYVDSIDFANGIVYLFICLRIFKSYP